MFFIRILVFAVSSAIGYVCLTKYRQVSGIFGPIGWAERRLGPGGTYTVWKLSGLLIWFLGFMYLLGKLDQYLPW